MNSDSVCEIMNELVADDAILESTRQMHNSEGLISVAQTIADFVGHGDVDSNQEIEKLLSNAKLKLEDVDFDNLSSYGPTTLIESVRRLSKVTDKQPTEIWNGLGLGLKENGRVLTPQVK